MKIEKWRAQLQQITVSRQLIEQLYSQDKISYQGREYALGLLYPSRQWGVWASRFLLVIGTILLLCGLVYFFAFNWNKIPPMMKLASIEIAMILCLLAAYYYSLQRLSGQLLLLAASVLVGVFLAVFGQIYQTGADAYQLFMVWSLLIVGWTFISNFAAQWVFWLAVTNIFVVLAWQQAVLPTEQMDGLIFAWLTILNGCFLLLREYFSIVRQYRWLAPAWSRMLLLITLLLTMLAPALYWIIAPFSAPKGMMIGGAIGLVGHAITYFVYRYKLPAMWPLAITLLSICLLLEVAACKIIFQFFDALSVYSAMLVSLLIGMITLAIFTGAIVYLRNVATCIKDRANER